jgi:hypothetical protein
MHIYLRHPQHGNKVAISDMEVAFDEKNGWVRYNADTPSTVEAQDAEPVNALVSAPVTSQRRRRTAN